MNQEHVLARRRLGLRQRHLVELAARIERLNRALHVAIVDGAAGMRPLIWMMLMGLLRLEPSTAIESGTGVWVVTDAAPVPSPRPPPGLCSAQTWGDSGKTQAEWKSEPADHAFEPEVP